MSDPECWSNGVLECSSAENSTTNEGSSFEPPEKISHWIPNDMDYGESCGRFESCRRRAGAALLSSLRFDATLWRAAKVGGKEFHRSTRRISTVAVQ
jgi:hypothetical protein